MIQKPEAGVMQGNDMPMSSASTTDLTDNVLGDASKADLQKGFVALDEARGPDESADYLLQPAAGGFVGRAKGWER